MPPLVRAVWRLVQFWWRGDRIRAPPREGRLLNLAPPCIVLVRGRPAQVVERIAEPPRLIYHCRLRKEICRLEVLARPGNPPRIRWVEWNGALDLGEDEIEVLGTDS